MKVAVLAEWQPLLLYYCESAPDRQELTIVGNDFEVLDVYAPRSARKWLLEIHRGDHIKLQSTTRFRIVRSANPEADEQRMLLEFAAMHNNRLPRGFAWRISA